MWKRTARHGRLPGCLAEWIDACGFWWTALSARLRLLNACDCVPVELVCRAAPLQLSPSALAFNTELTSPASNLAFTIKVLNKAGCLAAQRFESF